MRFKLEEGKNYSLDPFVGRNDEDTLENLIKSSLYPKIKNKLITSKTSPLFSQLVDEIYKIMENL